MDLSGDTAIIYFIPQPSVFHKINRYKQRCYWKYGRAGATLIGEIRNKMPRPWLQISKYGILNYMGILMNFFASRPPANW